MRISFIVRFFWILCLYNYGFAQIPIPHFVFQDSTGESYSIIIDSATLDGVELEIGDEIGIFTPANLCVGAKEWSGNLPLPLSAWADDSQTSEVDGYVAGEDMSFRIWDASATEEYKAIATYSTGDGTFGNGIYSRLSVLLAQSDKQAPSVCLLVPEKDAADVPRNTSIVLHLCDEQSGVVQSSIVMKIDGIAVAPVVTGDSTELILTYQPEAPFEYSQTIRVSIEAEDYVGNKMSQIYSFTIMNNPNIAPERPQLSSPENNSFIDDNTPELIWYIPQDSNGDSIHFKVEIATDSLFASPIFSSPFESQINADNFSPTPPVVAGNGSCLFLIPYPLVNGNYWWRVTASDKEFEGPPSATWKFTIFPTNVKTTMSDLPKEYRLHQNFPNPFNPNTSIAYSLPEKSEVSINIYSLNGNLVSEILREEKNAGNYLVNWNASQYSSGIYFIKIKAGDFVKVNKCILLK